MKQLKLIKVQITILTNQITSLNFKMSVELPSPSKKKKLKLK